MKSHISIESPTPAPAPSQPSSRLRRLFQQEDLNFLLTNRVPRIALTRLMGRFSQIRNPWVCRASIALWRLFTDLDLSDAKKTHFDSLHDCFTRELRPGARLVDLAPEVLSSPCDAIVGACGPVAGQQVFQAKGFPYAMQDLFGPTQDTAAFQDGSFVTLRLTSAMYHRFHAPHDCEIEHVTHIAGDTWNVNPIALKRVERLFCRNERAVLRARLRSGPAQGQPIAIVPVAAILVASLRLHFLDLLLHLGYQGANELACRAPAQKGEELGWFQHGSTIIVFAPRGFELSPGIETGSQLRMGQALMHYRPKELNAQPAPT
ncbi:archaetidylserine decarboxylase [Roseateles koreensis]|uniref:phosphatidylserine decarboxylase n=1 Tax=Roseateles koreensis TaxID=2987526 RepID=A0ABT5KS55_9BURK|nr:archaetidylserine decarboxylase [Roseateles koreensis]MDC8785756.1 archaetidylserine decarboxylase [Roseateles koreensis]